MVGRAEDVVLGIRAVGRRVLRIVGAGIDESVGIRGRW